MTPGSKINFKQLKTFCVLNKFTPWVESSRDGIYVPLYIGKISCGFVFEVVNIASGLKVIHLKVIN